MAEMVSGFTGNDRLDFYKDGHILLSSKKSTVKADESRS